MEFTPTVDKAEYGLQENAADIMICSDCVYMASLKKFVQNNGSRVVCNYCKSPGNCVRDSVLSELMREKAYKVLVPTDHLSSYEQGMVFECGSDTPHIFELWEFFEDYSRYACDEFMESFIQDLPSENDETGNTVLYALDDGSLDEINDFDKRWEEFLSSISNQSRFFNRNAKKFLDDLFQVLLNGDNLDQSVINTFNHDIPVYRARVAPDKETLKDIQESPTSHLGPTPSCFASNQRMSPEGISVFYGALDRETCISEIRPLVGDNVVSCEFRVLSEIHLLDLNKLISFEADFDVFHDAYLQHSHAKEFFKELVFQMSRPARRGNTNKYLPTQVVFEYFSVKYGHQIDGVMYSSVQQDQSGECIALFPQSSAVSQSGSSQLPDPNNPFFERDQSTLFLVPDSLRFHRIRGVSYQQQESENDFMFTAGEKILTLVGDRF